MGGLSPDKNIQMRKLEYQIGATVRVAVIQIEAGLYFAESQSDFNKGQETKVIIVGACVSETYIPYIVVPAGSGERWAKHNYKLNSDEKKVFSVLAQYQDLPVMLIRNARVILGKVHLRDDGVKCIICKNFIYMAAANRPDGTFLCHSCEPHSYLLEC